MSSISVDTYNGIVTGINNDLNSEIFNNAYVSDTDYSNILRTYNDLMNQDVLDNWKKRLVIEESERKKKMESLKKSLESLVGTRTSWSNGVPENADDILNWLVRSYRNRIDGTKLFSNGNDLRFKVYSFENYSQALYSLAFGNMSGSMSFMYILDTGKTSNSNSYTFNQDCIGELLTKLKLIISENFKSQFGIPLTIDQMEHTRFLNLDGWFSNDVRYKAKISELFYKQGNLKTIIRKVTSLNKEVLKQAFTEAGDDPLTGLFSEASISEYKDRTKDQAYRSSTDRSNLENFENMIQTCKKYAAKDIRQMFVDLIKKYDCEVSKAYQTAEKLRSENAKNDYDFNADNIQKNLLKLRSEPDIVERLLIASHPLSKNQINFKCWGLTSDYGLDLHDISVDGKEDFHREESPFFSHFLKFVKETPRDVWESNSIVNDPYKKIKTYDYTHRYMEDSEYAALETYRDHYYSLDGICDPEKLKILNNIPFLSNPYRGIRLRVSFPIYITKQTSSNYGNTKWYLKRGVYPNCNNFDYQYDAYMTISLLNSGYQEFKLGINNVYTDRMSWSCIFNSTYNNQKCLLIKDTNHVFSNDPIDGGDGPVPVDTTLKYKELCANESIFSFDEIQYMIWLGDLFFGHQKCIRNSYYACEDKQLWNLPNHLILEPFMKMCYRVISKYIVPNDMIPQVKIMNTDAIDDCIQNAQTFARAIRYNIISHYQNHEGYDWSSK